MAEGVIHGIAKAGYYSALRSGLVPADAASRIAYVSTLRRWITRLRPTVIVDIGANIGQFAAVMRQLGYRGWIVSAEPDPTAFATLQARFRDDARWRGLQIAVGDEDGELRFNIHPGDNSVLNSFLDSRNPDTARQARAVMVPVRRLDGVLPEVLEQPELERIFLKVDTQGYDIHVVRGAEGLLPRTVALLSELSVVPIYHGMPPYYESLQTYAELGFSPVVLSPVSHAADGRVIEFDGLFVRAG